MTIDDAKCWLSGASEPGQEVNRGPTRPQFAGYSILYVSESKRDTSILSILVS